MNQQAKTKKKSSRLKQAASPRDISAFAIPRFETSCCQAGVYLSPDAFICGRCGRKVDKGNMIYVG